MKKENKVTDLNAKKLFEELIKAAGKPIVYDAVVDQIMKKFGSDEQFINEVHKDTGIPTETIVREITAAATTPEIVPTSSKNKAQDNPNGPVQMQQEAPQMPTQNAPGLAGEQMPNMKPPQELQGAAVANQNKGMSPGQALNVANQQQNTPAMKKGGLLTKPTELESGGDMDTLDIEGAHRTGMKSGGSLDDVLEESKKLREELKDKDQAEKESTIEFRHFKDINKQGTKLDPSSRRKIGLLNGGLHGGLGDFNNSVEMNKGGLKDLTKNTRPKYKNDADGSGDPKQYTLDENEFKPKVGGAMSILGKEKSALELFNSDPDEEELARNIPKRKEQELAAGGSNDPPAGALPEEVADDQPVMLSRGEFVLPANVVRYLGLETIIALRDKALKGLKAMEEAGQIRRPGDNKNPGEDDEVEPRTILGGKTIKQAIKGDSAHELLEEHAIESIEEHAELLERVEELEDEDDLFMKSGGDLSTAKEGSTLALKTAHLKHSKNYGYNSLNHPPSGGGPNAMKSGGTIPPSDTTGIDPNPRAFKGSGRGGSMQTIGQNLGKRSRRMAAGGDVSNNLEQAGKYLNDTDNDKEAHRDSLPDYENFGDWVQAISNTPNIMSPGVIADAISGRGLFSKEDPAYVTVAERRAGLGSKEYSENIESQAASAEEQAAIQADNEKNAGERNAGLDSGPQVDIGIDQ